MEDFSVLLGVVFVVFGILQIILFFKMWGMTNDMRDVSRNTKDLTDKVHGMTSDMHNASKSMKDLTDKVAILVNHFCKEEGFTPNTPLSPSVTPIPPNYSTPLTKIKTVTRNSDGNKMRVDRLTNAGAYMCSSIDGEKFEGIYTLSQITIDSKTN